LTDNIQSAVRRPPDTKIAAAPPKPCSRPPIASKLLVVSHRSQSTPSLISSAFSVEVHAANFTEFLTKKSIETSNKLGMQHK
jgi:hypothetical protein